MRTSGTHVYSFDFVVPRLLIFWYFLFQLFIPHRARFKPGVPPHSPHSPAKEEGLLRFGPSPYPVVIVVG